MTSGKLKDLDTPLTFYVYRDEEGRWRWLLNTREGRTLAVAGESYAGESECRAAIGVVMRSASALVLAA